MKLSWENLLKAGYFSEVLPLNIFTSSNVVNYLKRNTLLNEIAEIENDLKNKKISSTPCVAISFFKSDLERRIITIPHIETYILLINEIEKNSEKIEKKINESKYSQSKIIKPYEISDYIMKSTFEKNYHERILKSTGYKYMLELDISKCYENIYTHSITWAYLGKENAKIEYNKNKEDRNQDYKDINELDLRLMAVNNNETKGISTGPLTSRVISELIFSEIDTILLKDNINATRYVDDYKIFFKTKQEAEVFIPKMQNILYEFKLNINTEKTKILKYPYEVSHNLRFDLGNFDFKKHGFISFLNRCSEFYINGNKGAYKYGLKVIEKKRIPSREKKYVLSQLINIMNIYPIMSELTINILNNNNYSFNDEQKIIIEELLEYHLKLNHDVEIIWLINLMLIFNISISEKTILTIFKKYETFSLIFILDYIHSKKIFTDKIKSEKIKLKEKLKSESIYGEKWLLLYECNLNNWIGGIKQNLNKSKFLKKLEEDKIKFYESPIIS